MGNDISEDRPTSSFDRIRGYLMEDVKFLKQAIENSRKSMSEGNFPAGAVVVKDGEVIARAVSSPYPGLFHADSKAVTEAFNKIGPLKGATLYVGLESCLMCTGVAYWSGIRRIVYAVAKSRLSGDYYETPESTRDLFEKFNEKIEFVHIKDLEEEALDVVRKWERRMLGK
jgi:tRNA(Arg) A34 adenosine deaminase TadA